MDANQQAAVAAGESIAVTAVTAFNPAIGASVQAIAALANAMLAKGPAMTMDDFYQAVAADDAEAAVELAAEAAAKPAPKP